MDQYLPALSVGISVASLALGVLVFVFARRKESTESADARWREHRAEIARDLQAADAKVRAAFDKVDALRVDLTQVRLDLPDKLRMFATRDELRAANEENARHFGKLGGSLEDLLRITAELHGRLGRRNGQAD